MDPLVRSTLASLSSLGDATEEAEDAENAEPVQENVIGERFTIAEFFDGSWSP